MDSVEAELTISRKPIFDTVRTFIGRGFTAGEVKQLDAAIDVALGNTAPPQTGRRTSPKGIALMHKWEGCKLTAYPDPGSADGNPWTIGWGSTGPDIRKGTVWTQEQADERFKQDLIGYERAVSLAIGDTPTTQDQFDALVSFHYNTGAIGKATLTRKHKAGDYAGAAAEFAKWIFNDGRPMDGLRNRRADEARLYRGDA